MQTIEDFIPANQESVMISAQLDVITVLHINRTIVSQRLYIV